MGIDQMTAHVAVPGKMKLAHPRFRHRLQVLHRFKAVIDAADIDIVNVEQDIAVGARGNLAQEFPLAHLVGVKAEIAGDILQEDLPAQGILHLTHACNHRRQRLFTVGQGQQIVQIASFDPGPAQMIRNPMRFDARSQATHRA